MWEQPRDPALLPDLWTAIVTTVYRADGLVVTATEQHARMRRDVGVLNTQVTVDLETGHVDVLSPQPRQDIVAAIENAGYRVQAA